MKPRVVVIGAGPAGLAFAARYGENAIVLERSHTVGGLSRSIQIRDGIFDIGGHSFHTPHENVRELIQTIMQDKLHQQPRDARVWFQGETISYPFQQHYTQLGDKVVVADCHHRHDPDVVAASKNFEEWIINRFGPGTARHFMLPYNRKLWARDLSEMSCDWVRERIVTEKSDFRIGDNQAPERQPLQSDSWVGYPTEGGFGSIFQSLAKRCKTIEFGNGITQIDGERRVAISGSGRSWNWEHLVSTMPLPALLDAICSCPERLRQLSAMLKAVSLKILMLLIKKPVRNVPQRIYICDPNVPSHKIAFNHTSSPQLAERLHHAVMCEVSYSDHKPCLPDAELRTGMIDWLYHAGYLADRADVVESQILNIPLGYPVNTLNKSAIIDEIKGYLSSRGIHSIGRFGSWDYANSDECIRQGLQLADRLILQADAGPFSK